MGTGDGAQAPLRLDAALARLADIAPVAGTGPLALAAAAGRILAEDIRATAPVPPFAGSAMDGWAVRAADLDNPGPTRLPVAGRIAAGHPLAGAPRPGHAYRIFTGAPLPEGFDTVAMQEDCRDDGETVLLPAGLVPGRHVRPAGSAVQAGAVPLPAGSRLGPIQLALAASLGITEILVRAPLRVAVFSTGDELQRPGTALEPGRIFDANAIAIAELLRRDGCLVEDFGIVGDDAPATRATIEAAARGHDLIVTSGGVSVGAEDHVRATLAAIGEIDLWRLALKPGKPVTLGRVGRARFLGLPGNPVSSIVSYLMFGRFLVAALAGAELKPGRRFSLPAAFALAKTDKRREFVRARLAAAEGGGLAVALAGADNSADIASLAACDGLIDLPEGPRTIRPGDIVDFLPLSEVLP